MDYKGKTVYVAGAARSGVSVSKLLAGTGASVTLFDLKENDRLAKELAAAGVKTVFGENPSDFTGVDVLIVSPGIPADLPFIESARLRGVRVIGEVEAAYNVCENPIIAITGTNGKTTVTSLVGDIAAKYRQGSVTCGNIGKPFSDYALTLPEEAFAVLEASSFQLETTENFKPKVAAVLNITPDHLNRHKTMENYAAIKARIFMNQTEEDFAVLNADDALVTDMAKRIKSRVLYFSRLKEVDGAYLKDGALYIGAGEKLAGVSELHIFGDHNIENALAASAVCHAAGVPTDVIRAGLLAFTGVEHRIEFTRELGGVKYYNDSKATNPDSAVKAINAVNALTFSKEPRIILIAGGRDKASDYSEWVSLFNDGVKLCVTLGEAAPLIEGACRERGFERFLRVNSMRGAVELSAAKAAAGDVVLLSPACASFDMFDNFEQRGEVFKKCVMDL